MNQLVDRAIGAVKLDVNLYEEVEADKTLLGRSMIVVIISSVAAGIGVIAQGGLFGIITGTIAALIGWLIWSYLTYIIGTKILPADQTRADYGELLRTMGFPSSSGVIRIFAIIPGLRWIVFFIAGIWMFAAMIVAIGQDHIFFQGGTS